jgi:hypothetical protein
MMSLVRQTYIDGILHNKVRVNSMRDMFNTNLDGHKKVHTCVAGSHI